MSVTPPPHQSFGSRLAAVFAGELINKGCVIAGFVWLARTLDPAVYGEVEWALALTMVFVLAADAGLSTWGAAQVAARPADAATLVGRIGALRLTLAGPAYLVLLGVAAAYGGRAGLTLAVYGLVLLLTPLFLQYLFNGLFQSRWAAAGNAVRGLTFAAVVLLFVRQGSPPWIVAIAEVAGAVALALCSVIVVRRVFRLPVTIGTAGADSRALLARTWTIGAAEVAWGAQWYAGVILLGYLATSTDAAWQSTALRLVMALHTIVWLYLYVLLPNLARLLAEDTPGWRHMVEESLRLTGWLGWGLAVVGTLGAEPILTTVFGPPFAAAVPALQAAIWIIPVAWMSGHIRYSLIAAGCPQWDYRAGLIGAGTTIALSVLLIPSLRSGGTGVALLAGTVANGVAAWVFGRRILPPFRFATSVAASSACGLGCLAGGLVLIPMTGAIVAAGSAGSVLGVVALAVERDRALDVLRTLIGGPKLKVGNANART